MKLLEQLKKDRKIQVGAAVAVILLVVSGFILFGGKSKPVEKEVIQDQTVQTISADKVGLSLRANSANNEIKILISKTGDIKSIDYELTYEANSTAQEQSEGGEARIQRGITGSEKIKDKGQPYESEWLVLGSASRNIKRYDTGVKSVSLTLKIVKEDGKILHSEKSLEL